MLKFALYLILHQLICKFFFYFIYDSTSNKATEIEEAIDIEIEGIRMKIKTKDLKFVMMALKNG